METGIRNGTGRAAAALLVVGVLGLGACRDLDDPAAVVAPPSAAFGLAEVAQDPTPSQMAVAQVVPGFGGYFIDVNGSPTVWLTDPGRRADAELALAGFLDSFGYAPSELVVRKATYDWLTLDGWYNRVWPQALAVGGAVFSDIDESTNRLRFGGVDLGAVLGISSTLTRLAVPSAAALVERTAAVHVTATLQEEARPVHGGYQINFLNVAGVSGVSLLCTLGFNALKDGVQSFITNSHCSIVQGGTETPTEYYQALQDPDGDRFVNPEQHIGTEVDDPHYFISLDCPVGRMCRYSDAARAEYAPGQEFLKGRIARTVASDPQLGTLEVDAANPMFRVVAEQREAVVGEIVNKVGRTTGWTMGEVFATCVNVNITASQITQLCQSRARNGVGGGDSGSPVFTLNTDETANLVGILWGSSTDLVTNEVTSIFSPMYAIERELGELDTADPLATGGKKPKKQKKP